MLLPSTLAISLLTLPILVQAAAVTSTVVVPAPQATSTSYTDSNNYRTDMLTAHNFFRKAHNASDLQWNDTLATAAQKWSDGCKFEHSKQAYGENLAIGYLNATANVDAWALERNVYNFNKPGFDAKTGHFTQLVWRNTTTVGCGRTSCDGQGWLVVCEYSPAGNVLGAGGDASYFRDNVLKQVEGKGTDTVESGVSATSGGERRVVSLGVGGLVVIAGVLLW